MKTVKLLLSIMLFGSTALVFQSCKDDDNNAPVASYINLLDNGTPIESYSSSISASSKMIGVRSDGDWTASSDADWCTISNHAGYGYGADSSFYVRVDLEKNRDAQRTANITFTSGNTTKVLTINQKGFTKDEGDNWMSSYEFVDSMKLGYNLGNTLESDPYRPKSTWWNPANDLAWETVWGQPKTTQAIIDSIAAKGFNVIRVPVTWWPHMDSNGNVNEMWMNRVKEVVDYVINAHCFCILNVMHDTGSRIYTSGSTSELRTDSAGWLSANPAEYEASSPRYKQLWNQIASEFKDYDNHLLFESFNEILDGDASTWGDPSDAGCYTTINKLQQDFVNTVRATGGNNEYRNLIVTTYSAGTSEAKLNGFQVPEDTHPQHLIASVHSYDPYNFCNDNSGDGYDYNIYMFDETCTAEIDAFTARINNRFSELGIPYIYGEFGAIDENKDMGERVKYAEYMVTKFKQYNTKGSWWMGLYNRKKKKWYEAEIVTKLFETLNSSK